MLLLRSMRPSPPPNFTAEEAVGAMGALVSHAAEEQLPEREREVASHGLGATGATGATGAVGAAGAEAPGVGQAARPTYADVRMQDAQDTGGEAGM